MINSDSNRIFRPQGSYTPYFYAVGRHYLYQGRGLDARTDNSSRSYDFTSDIIKPWTVERIVNQGYLSVPSYEPEIALIKDKKFSSGMGLDDVICQINGRHDIYRQNIYDLEIAKCEAINSVHDHEGYRGPADGKVEYALNKRLDKLYSDQRKERIDLWRDVSRLRQVFPENVQNYLSAYRKVSILEDVGDGL